MKKYYLFFIIYTYHYLEKRSNAAFVGEVQKNKRSAKEQAIIKELLKNYSSTVRPKGTIPVQFEGTTKYPVFVNVSVWVLSLSSFNDVTMEFTAQLGFQQEWYDSRLQFNHSYFKENDFINLASDQQLWFPDTFFQNEQQGHTHQIDQPNEFVKINSKGWVKYNKRLTMAFSCPMNLMLFPHDNQTCVIEFASYAYTTTDIILRWSASPVILSKNVNDSLPKFSLAEYDNQVCTSSTQTGEYSCLQIKFVLQREFSYFLLQLYIPSCMLVSVSCVSFWIDWRSAPARVPLTIVTLLTITTQAHGINANLPPVSYTKAIDIWIGACVVFIFGSLIEYAIVNYIGSNEEKKKARNHRGTMDLFAHKNQSSFFMHNNTSAIPNSSPQAEMPLFHWSAVTYGSIETYCQEGNSAQQKALCSYRAGLRFRPTDRRRRQREYRTLSEDQQEDSGDCFHRNEYVEFRRQQIIHPANFRHRRRRRSSWQALSDTMKKATRAEKIDMISRILFPLGFLGFNVVYWSLYYGF